MIIISGMSVLYMLFLAFALFQTREDFRKILFFFDPKLEFEGPDTKVRICSPRAVLVIKENHGY